MSIVIEGEYTVVGVTHRPLTNLEAETLRAFEQRKAHQAGYNDNAMYRQAQRAREMQEQYMRFHFGNL